MFDKTYGRSMSCGPSYARATIEVSTQDVSEIMKKNGMAMPQENNEAFLTRYSKELEKVAQEAIVAKISSLIFHPSVVDVFHITPDPTETKRAARIHTLEEAVAS